MKKFRFIKLLFLMCVCLSFGWSVATAQKTKVAPVKSQEISEDDGVPVLVKHLPDAENARNRAVFTQNVEGLQKKLGDRPIYDLIDFVGGNEAVAADYAQGKLLIIEYTTPQASVEMDVKTRQRLAELGQGGIFYRRIGNYNAFVFDAPDETAANALLDQVKYEKDVRWLGTNPLILRRAERAFINNTSDLFVSTLLIIVIGIGFAIVTGLFAGIVYFYLRDRRREQRNAFSDAGGMTRLNLDGLTSEISSNRLLKD